MTDPSELLCYQCEHALNPHMLFVTYDDLSLGGIVICNKYGCPCLNTWMPDDNVPPRTAAQWREHFGPHLNDHLNLLRNRLNAGVN